MNQPSKLADMRSPLPSSTGDTQISPSLFTGSNNVTLVETVSAERLIARWQTEYQIDIRQELRGVSEILRYRCNDTGVSYFSPRQIAGSDWLYEQLQQIPWYYQEDKWEYRVARRELRQCKSVFEVGCGTGAFLKILKIDGHDASGTELNQQAAAQARHAGLDVSVQPLGTVSKKFDAVCCFQVLEHVVDPASLIRGMAELTKSGGKIVFAVPNSDGFVNLGYDLLQYPPHHMSWWTAGNFRSMSSLFPIRLEKVVVEPLAEEHIEIYLKWNMWYLRERSGYYYWILNGKLIPIYRRLLKAGLRRFLTGHSLYAQFERL
jgi:SAM-dependent methyltransferase